MDQAGGNLRHRGRKRPPADDGNGGAQLAATRTLAMAASADEPKAPVGSSGRTRNTGRRNRPLRGQRRCTDSVSPEATMKWTRPACGLGLPLHRALRRGVVGRQIALSRRGSEGGLWRGRANLPAIPKAGAAWSLASPGATEPCFYCSTSCDVLSAGFYGMWRRSSVRDDVRWVQVDCRTVRFTACSRCIR
jgi:hypothetical protein